MPPPEPVSAAMAVASASSILGELLLLSFDEAFTDVALSFPRLPRCGEREMGFAAGHFKYQSSLASYKWQTVCSSLRSCFLRMKLKNILRAQAWHEKRHPQSIISNNKS
jgi:hypothetical protein